MMIDCFHKWHFLTTACTICLNQIHPRLKWLYGPVHSFNLPRFHFLIWLRRLLFLDRCMVLFSFYVEVFVENACVCIRLIGPTYVVVLFIWLFAVFTVMLLAWSSRLSMWIKLILSYVTRKTVSEMTYNDCVEWDVKLYYTELNNHCYIRNLNCANCVA